jgi:hypothetical protein
MDTIILEYLTSYLHFFSSVLWWGLTFFVVVILRPVNRNGSYSLILPRIHQFILPLSTLSITSGLVLTLININFDPNRLFNSFWVIMLMLGGLFSIPVYLVILFRSKKRTIKIQFGKKKNFQKTNFLPFLLFALLSSTIFIMVFVTKLFR